MTAMTRLNYYKADVFVELIDFKDAKGNEMLTQNADGSYTIFLNTRKSFETQQEAVRHALRHIENNDFEKHDIQQIEAEAHQIVKPVSEIEKIIEEQREAVTEQLNHEPRYVKYEIEVRERLIKAQQENDRRRFELERKASFNQWMWENRQDEFLAMLEAQKLYGGI